MNMGRLGSALLWLSLAACRQPATTIVRPAPSATVDSGAHGVAVHGTGDSDGDGLVDDTDHCADAAEDLDGFDDRDGCPDPDDDGDGVADDRDRCRDEGETMNGFEDDDGCFDRRPRAKQHPGLPPPGALPACCSSLRLDAKTGTVIGCPLRVVHGFLDTMPPRHTAYVDAGHERRGLWVDRAWHRPVRRLHGKPLDNPRWILDVEDNVQCGVLGSEAVIIVLEPVS
jgi:hypothetical protein